MKRSIAPLLLFVLTACAEGMGVINDWQQAVPTTPVELTPPPTNGEMIAEAAKNAEQKGDFSQAAQLYGKMYEKNPQILLAMAESYRRSGDYTGALTVYDMLLEKEPGSLDALEGKGLTLLARGDIDAPVPLFEAIMKEDPKRWKTLNALGILFITRSMQPEAQQYFTEALKHSADNAVIYNNMGMSQALDRHFDDASACMQRATELAGETPRRRRIELNKALVLASSGKMDEAGETAKKYYTGEKLGKILDLYGRIAKDEALAASYLMMAATENRVIYPEMEASNTRQ